MIAERETKNKKKEEGTNYLNRSDSVSCKICREMKKDCRNKSDCMTDSYHYINSKCTTIAMSTLRCQQNTACLGGVSKFPAV